MLSYTKSILRHIYRTRYEFCQGNSSKHNKPALNIKNLKENIERDHSYVRKNNEEIGHHLISNIQISKWSFVKKILLAINLNDLDSWFLMRKIAKVMNNSCNGLSLQSMNKQEILDLLSVIVLLRFQPKKLKADSFKGRSSEFDDSTPFINELEAHIKGISINKDQNHFFQLSRKLLHTNPLLFLSRREEFERKLLNRLETLMENKSLLNEVLVRGCISNYWTKQFKAQILNKKIPGNYLKALHFEDLHNPTVIQKAPQQFKIKTQEEIMNILHGFGYIVNENVLVNGYEVDFLINNKLVVEFNGPYHYIINSKKLFPTAKDRWKEYILRRRNFTISSIPFSQWKVFRLFEQKRKYIVTKIQSDWLKQYKYSRMEHK